MYKRLFNSIAFIMFFSLVVTPVHGMNWVHAAIAVQKKIWNKVKEPFTGLTEQQQLGVVVGTGLVMLLCVTANAVYQQNRLEYVLNALRSNDKDAVKEFLEKSYWLPETSQYGILFECEYCDYIRGDKIDDEMKILVIARLSKGKELIVRHGLEKLFKIYSDKNPDSKKEFIALVGKYKGTICNHYRQIDNKYAQAEGLSPSEIHFLNYFFDISLQRTPEDVVMLEDTILKNEQRLVGCGYAPFYHAQSKEKWFPIALDTFLYGLQRGESVDEFYLMHTQKDRLWDQVAGEGHINWHTYDELLKKDACERARMQQHGNQQSSDRTRMLFLNGSLRGNIENSGSQSFPGYFIANKNAGINYQQSKNIIKNIFAHRGVSYCYVKFEHELHQLYEEYVALSKYGTLYQIGVPEHKISRTVRPVISGGFKTCLNVGDECTEDMCKIARAFKDPKNHPGDENEFVMLMTYDEDGGMNVRSGIKIKAYMIPTDEVKYQAWQAKWEDLKLRIKAEVECARSADWVAPARAYAEFKVINTRAPHVIFAA